MKKVMYIHGAFSAFKPKSEKVLGLKKEFEVCGISYSMEKSFHDNLKMLEEYARKECVDFVVGTSLGGLYAAAVAFELGVTSILINPSVEPKRTLPKLIGTHENYATGQKEVFTKELAESFPEQIILNNYNYVFLGLKDDIIDPIKTREMAERYDSKVFINENEDHYWEFFEYNEEISDFISNKIRILRGCSDKGVKETVERMIKRNNI